MAEFWENDPADSAPAATGNFWEQDAVDKPKEAVVARGADVDTHPSPVARTESRMGSIVGALTDSQFWSDVGTNAADLGRRINRAPGAILDVAGAQLKSAGAGATRLMADIDEGMARSASTSYQKSKVMTMAQRREAVKHAEALAQQAKDRGIDADLATEWAANRAQQAVPTDAGFIERNIIQGGGSALALAPIIAAGAVIPGAQAPALAALGGVSGASRYGQLRAAGIDKNDAALSGVAMGGLDALTEAFPLGALAKRTPFVKQAAEFLITDIFGENVSSLAQLADDFRLGLRDDVTMQDIKDSIADTTMATAGGAGLQLGSAHLLGAVLDKANARAAERTGPTEADLDQATEFARRAAPNLTVPEELKALPSAPNFETTQEGTTRKPGQPPLKALPASVEGVPSDTFVAGENGAKQLTQAEVANSDREREARAELGSDNVTRVPLEALEAIQTGKASSEQVEQARSEGLVSQEGQLLPVGRRKIQELKRGKLKAAVTDDTKAIDIAVVAGEQGMHGVKVGPIVQAWYPTKKIAQEEATALRGELGRAQPTTEHQVLGQAVSVNTQPTEGQKAAGNYTKGALKWNGRTIKIENPTGSVRSGTDATGKAWSNSMAADYGYFSKTEAKDGDHVDVFVGKDPLAEKAYVVDQLTPDGKSYDEAKTVIGVSSKEEAEALYRKHYPKNAKVFGAITEMSVPEFNKWLDSDATKKPVAWGEKADVTTRYQENEAPLKHIANAGWYEIGGRAITDEDAIKPTVTGRTQWLAKNPQWAEAQQTAPLPKNTAGKATQAAVRKALAGEPLSAAETRHVNALVAAEQHRIAEEKRFEDLSKVDTKELDARMQQLKDLDSILGKAEESETEKEARIEREAIQVEEPKTKYGTQPDLFGDKVALRNELKRLEAEKDRRRNSGQESVETGKADDLFSEARKQRTIEEPKKAYRENASDERLTGTKVADKEGKPLRVYHGTGRGDRFVQGIKAGRATSGPMPYFTESPEIASNYAKGKADTSLDSDEMHYGNWFQYKPKGARAPQPIQRMWWDLTPEQRSDFNQKMRDIGMDDDGNVLDLGKNDGLSPSSFDWELKQKRGNGLEAAIELWLTSGAIFNDEHKFMTVLKLAGINTKQVDYVPQYADAAQTVVPVYLAIKNPLDTENLPEGFVTKVEAAVRSTRGNRQLGSDAWDKNTRFTPKEWVKQLREEIAEGGSQHVWTSIPDQITKAIASMGYDGIKDVGGKNTGEGHTVWIPFRREQVVSATGKHAAVFDRRAPYQQQSLPLGDPYASLKVRPNTNAQQLDDGRAALASIERRIFGTNRSGLWQDASVLGAGISKDFRDSGFVSLTGLRAASAADYALIAQVARHPRLEHFRVSYMDDAGNILGEHAYSSGMPGFVSLPPTYVTEIKDDMQRLGASTYRALHNHPSADPTPSAADISLTEHLARSIPGFKGHVILDHNSYGSIDLANGVMRGERVEAPWLNNIDFEQNPELPHRLLGERLISPNDAARILKGIQTHPDYITIVATASGSGKVRFVMELPASNLTIPSSSMAQRRAVLQIKRAMQQAGASGNIMAVMPTNGVTDTVRRLDAMNVFTDIISASGNSLAQNHQQDLDKTLPLSQRAAKGRLDEHLEEEAAPYMELRKHQQNTPKWEWEGYQVQAQKLIDWWNQKAGWRYGPLGKLPEQTSYLKARYQALGDIGHIKRVARHIFDALKAATPEDVAAVYDYMTTRDASPDAIEDEKIKSSAMQAKALIAEQGRQLWEAGLLSDEAMERYAGEYLPRMYLKHVLGDKMFGEMGYGKKLSSQGNLKMRKDIPIETRKFILGEITDPAFLASFSVSRVGRDLALMDFLQFVSQNKSWAPPQMMVEWNGKQVSPYWIASEAARLRRQANFVKEHPTAAKMREIADRMDALADRAKGRLDTEVELDDFKQIPDSPRYGMLRGLWVRKEIYEDLVGAQTFIEPSSFEGMMQRTSGKIMRAFKFSKVAANIPSHFRNMMGNSIMLHLSGVPFRRVYSGEIFLKAINSILKKDEFYQIAMKYGMSEASFNNNELASIRDEWLAMQESESLGNGPAKIKAMFGRVTKGIGDIYQFEEQLGKLAKLRDAMEREGMEEADAMIEAHKWTFDYSLVPRWVRYARQTPLGTPFLSYTYLAMPRMAEALIKHPWKYLPYMAVPSLAAEMMKYMWDTDDDDLKKAKEATPSWMKSSGGMMLMPWKDEVGRLQMLNLGYITPWGMLADLSAQAENDSFGGMLSTSGLFSGPLPNVIAAVKTGIDPFTKKEIIPSGATPREQAEAVVQYALNMAVPGMFSSTGAFAKLKELHDGKVNKYTGDVLQTPAQAWSRLFGITIYPYDPEDSRELNLRFMQREIEDIKSNTRNKLKDQNILNDPTKADEIRQEAEDLIERRQQDMQLYEQKSDVSDKLKRDTGEHRPLSDLIGAIQPITDHKSRQVAVQALRSSGNPALASLIEAMPTRPRPLVAASLRQEAASV